MSAKPSRSLGRLSRLFLGPQPSQFFTLGLDAGLLGLVSKGRSRGLSMTMVTQRPQSIKKAVIEESDVIVCHRIMGPRAAAAS